eukprot:1195040-Prorocentrum_minimum.AAC.4
MVNSAVPVSSPSAPPVDDLLVRTFIRRVGEVVDGADERSGGEHFVKFRSGLGQQLLARPPGGATVAESVSGYVSEAGPNNTFPYNHTYTEQDKCTMPVSGPIWWCALDVKGSTVDVKGSTVDVKGFTMDVKGSAEDVKGSTLHSGC